MNASTLSVPSAGSNGVNSDGVNGKVALVKKRRGEKKGNSCAAHCQSVIQNKSRAAVSPARTGTIEGVSDGGEEIVSLPPPAIALDDKVVEEREKEVVGKEQLVHSGSNKRDGRKSGHGFTAADLSSETESEPVSHQVNDARSVCSAPSNMEEAENEARKQSAMQEKRCRIRVVPSRYMAIASRPVAVASKRYPSPAVGQSMRVESPQPPPRALSAEKRRPSSGLRPFDENPVPRGGRTPKPVSTPGLSQTMGLWARTNSTSGGSVDVRAVSDSAASARVADRILSRSRPVSAQKGKTVVSEQDSIQAKTWMGRVSSAGAQRPRNGKVFSCRPDGISNGGSTSGVLSAAIAKLRRSGEAEQQSDGQSLRNQAQGFHPFSKRASTPGCRLVGASLSRSVDLSVSGSLVPVNRRATAQQPRSRSTTRGGVLELKNLASSVLQEGNAGAHGGASASRAHDLRYPGRRVSAGGLGLSVERASSVGGSGAEVGEYRDNEGNWVAAPSVPSAAIGAAEETRRYNRSDANNLEITLNNDPSFDERTSISSEPSDRGIDRGGALPIGEVLGNGPDRGSADATDGFYEKGDRNSTECCSTECRAKQEGRSNKENQAASVSNCRRNQGANVVQGPSGTLGENRGLGTRPRVGDANPLQRGGDGGLTGDSEAQPHVSGGSGDVTDRGVTNSKRVVLSRRPSEAIGASNGRPNGTGGVAAKTGFTSPWRSNSFSGTSSTGASAWVQSPSRALSQQLVGTGLSLVASPPVKPLSGQPAPGNSPILTPPGVSSSPGLRPRSAVEGTKARSNTLMASPSHTASAANVPVIQQLPPASNMNPQMLARHVRVLHNRWLEWRFLNAKQKALARAQQNLAETALYSAWASTAELRSSVTMKRIQLQRAKQAQRLDSTLSSHATRLEEWTQIKQEHTCCFSGAIEALETAMRQVPLVNGAKADLDGLKSLLSSATQVMDTVNPTITQLMPKVESTESLLSQLAEVVTQERALLEECGELLSRAATLEVEERSLRAQRLQLAHELEREQQQANDGDILSSTSGALSRD